MELKGLGPPQSWALRNRWVKGGWWFKNLTGTLHIGGIACTLSVDREVKMEIPVHPA
jgi:hypothetical protein